jgi:hypothetical protein
MLIKKLFLFLFLLDNPHISSNNEIIEQNTMIFNDGELVLSTINKIRNEDLNKNNIKNNKEISHMLSVLKDKIKIANIDSNKMEVIFNNKKNNKYEIVFLTKEDRDNIIKIFDFLKIPLSIKSNFQLYTSWILKIIGILLGVDFLLHIIKGFITNKMENSFMSDLLKELNNFYDKTNKENNKQKFDDKKINLIDKYILSNPKMKEFLEDSQEYKALINEYKNNPNNKKITLEDFIENSKEKILEIIPKEILEEILVDFSNKNLSIENYTQHLSPMEKERFENIKDTLASTESKKKPQIYIFNGDGGSGKTKLANEIINHVFLTDFYETYIKEKRDKEAFKESVLYAYKGSDFGVKKYVGTGNQAFEKFTNQVVESLESGKKVYVIVDEANQLIQKASENVDRDYNGEARNDFLAFADQLKEGIYSKHLNNLVIFLTTNLSEDNMHDPSKRRASGGPIPFVSLPTTDNLYILIQDILFEEKTNNANSNEEELIYNNIKKYIKENRGIFDNLLEAMSLAHKKIYLKAKINDLTAEMNNKQSETIKEEKEAYEKMLNEIDKDTGIVDFANTDVIKYMEKKVGRCGSTKTAKIIKGLDEFIKENIINLLLYDNNEKPELIAKSEITKKDLQNKFKTKERKKKSVLNNASSFYSWLDDFFKNQDNMDKLEKILIYNINK